jgi:hypothetical protein
LSSPPDMLLCTLRLPDVKAPPSLDKCVLNGRAAAGQGRDAPSVARVALRRGGPSVKSGVER